MVDGEIGGMVMGKRPSGLYGRTVMWRVELAHARAMMQFDRQSDRVLLGGMRNGREDGWVEQVEECGRALCGDPLSVFSAEGIGERGFLYLMRFRKGG